MLQASSLGARSVSPRGEPLQKECRQDDTQAQAGLAHTSLGGVCCACSEALRRLAHWTVIHPQAVYFMAAPSPQHLSQWWTVYDSPFPEFSASWKEADMSLLCYIQADYVTCFSRSSMTGQAEMFNMDTYDILTSLCYEIHSVPDTGCSIAWDPGPRGSGSKTLDGDGQGVRHKSVAFEFRGHCYKCNLAPPDWSKCNLASPF